MKAKLCYKDEIHRVSNMPNTYEDLIKLIPSIFHAQLPESWTLQYKDSDGDNILITDAKDYEEFKHGEPGNASAISKIFVISAEAFKSRKVVLEETNIIEPDTAEIKREEDYQVIEVEESKPEERIEVREEVYEPVPVQDSQSEEPERQIEETDEIINEPEVKVETREEERVEEQEERLEEPEIKEEVPEPRIEQEDEEMREEEEIREETVEVRPNEEPEDEEEEPMKNDSVEPQEPQEEPELEKEPEKVPEEVPEENQPQEEEEDQVREETTEVKQPVEDQEEQKSEISEKQLFESQDYSKIQAPRSEKMTESYELMGSKMCVDVNDLKMLVSSMIEKKLPEMLNDSLNQSMSQSLNQSVVVDSQSILLTEEQLNKPKVTHYNTKCMGCGMAPIQGIRYKCTICPSFDYCAQCEDAGTHPHNFIKMRLRDMQDIFKPPQSQQFACPAKPAEWKKSGNFHPLVPDFVAPKKPQQKKQEESQKKKGEQQKDADYYNELIEKAKKLQKCFPKEDFDMLCVYISDAPQDMSMEELVENYKLGLKSE